MTTQPIPREPKAEMTRTLALALCRLAALLMFAFGLLCWARLIGVVDGPLWRFDLMPFGWKIVMPALAVLYPIAAIGLWMAVSWGPVVWVIVAGVEGAALVSLSPPRDPDGLVLGVHLAGLACLLGLKAAERLRARRRA